MKNCNKIISRNWEFFCNLLNVGHWNERCGDGMELDLFLLLFLHLVIMLGPFVVVIAAFYYLICVLK